MSVKSTNAGCNHSFSVSILDPNLVSPEAKSHDNACRAFRQIVHDAQSSATTSINVVENHAAAELVIVPASTAAFGPRFERLKRNRVFRAIKSKAVVYSNQDLFNFPLPGLYPACTSSWRSAGWAVPAHYRSDHLPMWNFSAEELASERDLLASFIGELKNHPVRKKLATICHPRIFVHDPSPGPQRWWDRSWEEQVPFKLQFRESLLRSKFVLCPRGKVASSIRIFEALEAGAVPVLIADGLILPQGPSWDDFTIRIREREVSSIPAVLESLEPIASRMGAAARKAWETYFSPATSFKSLITWAVEVQHNMANRNMLMPRIWSCICLDISPLRVGRRVVNLKRRMLKQM